MHDVYAASECFPIVTYDPTTDPRPRRGYAGRVVPEARLRIDAHGEAIATGPALMLGYWDDPVLTAATLTDEDWQLVKRAIGIDRGWEAAYQLVSSLDLPGPPANIPQNGP